MRLLAISLLVGFGLSLSAFGCSDPVAPIPEGAWSVSFGRGANTNNCNIATHNESIGVVSASSPATLATDGLSDTSITCSVTAASGGTFNVDAQGTKGGNNLHMIVKGISKSATADAPATGVLSYSSPETADAFTAGQDAPCDFYFVADTKETITAGSMWLAFSCDTVKDTNNVCGLSGYAKYANCEGTPAAN